MHAQRRTRNPADLEAIRTAHFYLALQNCQLGNFSVAEEHLAKLGLGVRLSDAVWSETCSLPLPETFFVRVIDDGLPPGLVQRVKDRLRPEALYWKENRYFDKDLQFYSHAHHLGEDSHVIDRLIEALRPLLAQVAPMVASSLHIAEWWAHQRHQGQWHGHPLHFDTNEQLLRESQGSCVEHPAISTVVYLSDASPRFGPTLVTNQKPCHPSDPEFATVVHPRCGRVLFFDGRYLHGALPGRPWLAADADNEHRLCVMVGWWTSFIKPQTPRDPPCPVMLTNPAAHWVSSLANGGTAEEPRHGRLVEVKAMEPIWTDVPIQAEGSPFFGRFFLSHRGQIDEDILN